MVTTDGAVFHWGRVYGRAIDDNHSVRPRMFLWEDINWTPTRVPLPVMVRQVACGPAHCALVSVDGHLWTFGSNKARALSAAGRGALWSPVLACRWASWAWSQR